MSPELAVTDQWGLKSHPSRSEMNRCLANINSGWRCPRNGVEDLTKSKGSKTYEERMKDLLCTIYKHAMERQVGWPLEQRLSY